MRVVNNARHARYLHLDALPDVLASNPTHPRAERLRPFVDVPAGGLTRSELEDRFVAFAKRQARRLNTILKGRRRTLTVLSNSLASMPITGAPIPERPAS